MANTTNFNWETPDDTDLVKDGAAAIRTLGNSIDTSLVDLKGGTTGQVLSKTSGTDMDFTWVTTDDANAIQNSIINAKGDLIAGSANDTPAILAAGNNGETLVADSAATTGLRWQGDYAAGKNKIINGDFGIWQRGTSFSDPASSSYLSDRFYILYNGSGATRSITQQTFTPGAAPVSGYEGAYFLRYARTVAGSSATADRINQRIEDVRTFAGQTITVSFWAKVDSGTPTLTVQMLQAFGSGGSGDVNVSGSVTLSTTWTRYTTTLAIGSISGKTIGTNSFLELQLRTPVNTIQTFDFWGVQVEAGNVSTAFQTATGTIQGELAACQRYYQVIGGTAYPLVAGYSSTASQSLRWPISYPVQMRTTPTATKAGTWNVSNAGQPSAVFLDKSGFSVEITSTTSGMIYAYPDSSDDVITFSAEL